MDDIKRQKHYASDKVQKDDLKAMREASRLYKNLVLSIKGGKK